MDKQILCINNLSVSFGEGKDKVIAVDDVSLLLKRAEY